jgi:hypothetical protein
MDKPSKRFRYIPRKERQHTVHTIKKPQSLCRKMKCLLIMVSQLFEENNAAVPRRQEIVLSSKTTGPTGLI